MVTLTEAAAKKVETLRLEEGKMTLKVEEQQG